MTRLKKAARKAKLEKKQEQLKKKLQRELSSFEEVNLGTYAKFCKLSKRYQCLRFELGHKGLGVSITGLECAKAQVSGYFDCELMTTLRIDLEQTTGSLEEVQLGEVGVDTGSLLIHDPINSLPMDDESGPTCFSDIGVKDSYELFLHQRGITIDDRSKDLPPSNPVVLGESGEPIAVQANDFGGDGHFDVIGYVDSQGKISHITITFITHNLEDEPYDLQELEYKNLGSFKIESKRLLITDPCYIL
jgi:hypothetical protein